MDNVFSLQFIINPENHKVKIEDWQSFRSNGYSCQIFHGLLAVRLFMSKSMNRIRMAQIERASAKINFFPYDAFDYIGHSLQGSGSTRSRNANHTLKHIYRDQSKMKLRHRVTVDEIFIDTDEGINRIAHLFGVLATKGTRSKHPNLGQDLCLVEYGATLNTLSSVKFSHIREFECLSLAVRYNSFIVQRP